MDLNGKCSKPANLKEGETGVCIEAFIASKTIGGIGKGDNRTFTGTDPSKTQRVRVDITIAPGRDGAINSTVTTARSETLIPGVSAQGHTEMIPVSVTTDAQGNRNFEVDFTAINGFAGLPGAPAGGSRPIWILALRRTAKFHWTLGTVRLQDFRHSASIATAKAQTASRK